MKNLAVLLAGITVACLSTPALAASKWTAEKQFNKLDTDGNGSITLEEFVNVRSDIPKTKATKNFAFKDKNKDGKISFAELKSDWDKYNKK